jgi:hypothetical protein
MSGPENEIRERRGKSPDFPWKDEALSGTDKEAVKEHDSGEDEAVAGDTRQWGSKEGAIAEDQEPSIEGPPKEPDAGSDDTEKARARKKTGPSF